MVCASLILPHLTRAFRYLHLYYPALTEQTPTLLLYDHKLDFIGHVPAVIELDKKIRLFFGTQPNDSLYNSSAVGSLYFDSQVIKIKFRHKVHEINFDHVNVNDEEPLEIKPVAIRKLIDKFARFTVFFIILVIFPALLLLVHLFALFLAGMGLMFDAFRNGPFAFIEYLGLASSFIFIFVLALSVIGIPSFQALKYMMLALFLLFLIAANLVISRGLAEKESRKSPIWKSEL